jgi:hypothetical protein
VAAQPLLTVLIRATVIKSVLLQMFVGAPPLLAASVPATAVLVDLPAQPTKFDYDRIQNQAPIQISPALPQQRLGLHPQDSASGPANAVRVEIPGPATNCELVYTPQAPQPPKRQSAGQAGHEAGGNPTMVYGPSSFPRGTARAESDVELSWQTDLEKSVSCWPCEVKPRV